MDVLDSQALSLATLEPFYAKPSQDVFGSLAAESLDPADPTWVTNQDTISIQAALTGETRIGTDGIAANTGTSASLAAGDSITGFVNSNGDHDWFRVQLTAGTTYLFNLNRIAGLIDPLLSLRSSTGALITQNNDADGGRNSALVYTATSSGTFFLDAGANNNTSTGQYQLLASRRVSDQYAANTSTTGTISAGSSISSTIDSRGDHDWFKIVLTAGKNYVFNLNKVGTTGLTDPLLNLRNSTGTVIATNDDANGTINSQINFTATVSGTYFLDAGAYGDSSTGAYQLLAAESAPTQAGYSSTNGYGEASVERALEKLLNISIPSVADLGGIFWGLDRLGAPEAWAAGYTGAGITVAVVDTGVDYTHSDLDGNIWINSREIAGNGIDDDGNGFIDDVRGWNFDANSNNVMDDNSHGTHVAGTIAGENNGVGVTGVAYNAKIMAVKVLNGSGSGTLTSVANGIRYAANNGANVINLSLGGGGSTELLDAVSYATSRGAVVVMAAGNEAAASPSAPASYARSYGLAVGAIDSAGNLASFSNRAGVTQLDYITAAGVNVYSSVPGNGYASYSGTSMATPHIAGAMALLQQANIQNNKGLSVAALETLITSTASNMVTAGSLATSTTATGSGSSVSVATSTPIQLRADRLRSLQVEEENAVGRSKEWVGTLPLSEGTSFDLLQSSSTNGTSILDARDTGEGFLSSAVGLTGSGPLGTASGSNLPSTARAIADSMLATVIALTETGRFSPISMDPITGLSRALQG